VGITKIALLSDFHLGYNEDALMQASEALAKAVEKSDLVIVAGDIFDSRVPKQEVLYDAINLFRENLRTMQQKSRNLKMFFLSEEGEEAVDSIPVVAVYGTHERRTKGLANAIQLLHSAGLVINVHARKLVVEKLDSTGKVAERVAIQGLGGVPEEYARRSLEFLASKPVPNALNMFIFHQSLRELLPVDGDFISAADLPNGFDLYVDGHIHWSRELKEGGKHIVLPGSTVVTQMKESESNPKGFFVYDSLSRQLEFVNISARPFVLIDLAFENASLQGVESRIAEEVARVASAHAVPPLVKLKLRGTLARGVRASALDASSLERKYAGQVVLSVDKSFDSPELKEKIETLRKIREEKKSIYDAGMEILKEKLRELGFKGEGKQGGAGAGLEEELFELLSEGEVEKALKALGAA
jgi:DNA repair exonuclease SbcCD nuclease subunit